MNKTALITVGKKLKGNDLYLLSVFDLEPSGVIVHAYNQVDSKEYQLNISEYEFSKARLKRNSEELNRLIDSIDLIEKDGHLVLYTSIDDISNIKIKPGVEGIDKFLSAEIKPGSESVNEVLVRGLVELCKVKPVGLDAVSWLGEWLLANNPSKPRVEDEDE
mmetsp:Transcript_719/g.628  ORF Transcript_719/g.628 Transcript_719/m.628 type:complete len:162 (-) Transcript_719:41-526(-)